MPDVIFLSRLLRVDRRWTRKCKRNPSDSADTVSVLSSRCFSSYLDLDIYIHVSSKSVQGNSIFYVSWTVCDVCNPKPDGDEPDATVDDSDGAAEQPQLPEDTRNVMWNVLAELGIPQAEENDEYEEEED